MHWLYCRVLNIFGYKDVVPISSRTVIDSQTKPEWYIDRTNAEFDKYICEKYPLIFRQRGMGMDKSCMHWGLTIGEGWNFIIESACQKINKIYELTGVYTEASQIKEKYGTLRFYNDIKFSESEWLKRQGIIVRLKWLIGMGDVSRMNEDMKLAMLLIEDVISKAESDSEIICEECGNYGRANVCGWIITLCDLCRSKQLKISEEEVDKWFKDDKIRRIEIDKKWEKTDEDV